MKKIKEDKKIKIRFCLNCKKRVEDLPCPYCGNPVLKVKSIYEA